MWLLLSLAYVLFPALGLAQSSPNQLFTSGSTIQTFPVAPNISVLRDLDGNSATIFHNNPRQSFYHFEDSKGRVHQGYIFNNLALPAPIESPSLDSRLPLSERMGMGDCIYCR